VAAAALLRDDPRLGGGGTSWTARTMTGMAEQVLQEMDKATVTATATAAADTAVADHDHAENSRNNDNDADAIANDNPATGTATASAPAVAVPPAGMMYDDNVFEHLDPAFDLDAVDAAIEGSLDFGASSNWFDWQQHNWSFTTPHQ